jgi:hypothetical protein
MPIQKFIELDSTYRNRNMDPNPASFSVGVSQYGIKEQPFALDPISNAYPQIVFTPNEYVDAESEYRFDLVLPPSTPNTLYLLYSEIPPLPPTVNFMVGLCINQEDGNTYYRISQWEMVSAIDATNQIFKATLDGNFNGIVPDTPLIIKVNLTDPYYFLPASLNIPNYYNNYYIQNQTKTFSTNPPILQYNTIKDFDRDSHYAIAKSQTDDWVSNEVYIVRKELPMMSKYVNDNNTKNASSLFVGSSFFTNLDFNNIINCFIRFVKLNDNTVNEIRKIVSYSPPYSPGNPGTFPDTLIFDAPLSSTPKEDDQYEILQYTKDNYSPFVYTGTMSSNSQPVVYEMTLNSLTLPNQFLKLGGRIAYYPYVYVIVENISTTGGNPKNLIYSNNPNTYRAVFRAPITDLNHPQNSPFVKLTGNGMKQTITFKQNDDISMTVLLPNGEIFETEMKDNFGGLNPNPMLQISAVFSMERIV